MKQITTNQIEFCQLKAHDQLSRAWKFAESRFYLLRDFSSEKMCNIHNKFVFLLKWITTLFRRETGFNLKKAKCYLQRTEPSQSCLRHWTFHSDCLSGENECLCLCERSLNCWTAHSHNLPTELLIPPNSPTWIKNVYTQDIHASRSVLLIPGRVRLAAESIESITWLQQTRALNCGA